MSNEIQYDMSKVQSRVVLGLDIGIASIGWSVVHLLEAPFVDEFSASKKSQAGIVNFEIIDLGVRTFAKSEDRMGKSYAKARGEARRLRRTLERRRKRRAGIRLLLQEYGFVPKGKSRKNFEEYLFDTTGEKPVWDLRTLALDKKLSEKELARVIYHIIGHRGFYFSSKSDEKSSEDSGAVKSSMARLEQWKSCRTVGEWLSKQKFQRNYLYKDKKREQDKDKAYHYCIHRKWLQDELKQILNKQKALGHNIDEKFIVKADELLMKQRGYDSEKMLKMWGKCPIFDEELRAPRCSASAEYFAILNRVNNLRLIDKDKNFQPLTADQCDDVIKEVYARKGQLTFKQLRKMLGAHVQDMTFNLCNYADSKLQGVDAVKIRDEREGKEKVVPGLTGTKAFADVFGKKWPEMQLQRLFLDDLAYVLSIEKEDDKRINGFENIEKEHGIQLSQEEIDDLLTLSFSETATYGFSALRTLLRYMEPLVEGDVRGLLHHEAMHKAVQDGALPDIKSLQEQEKSTYIPPYHGDFLRNPVVSRVFSQTRKLINAIQKKYTNIDVVHIEVGTEIANGKVKRGKIKQGQDAYKSRKERAVQNLQECGFTVNSANILKMRLYNEQGGRCPYTGQSISLERGSNHIYFDDCEVDHILPFSRTFNDSINNKVLVTAKANRDKGNRIPREWFNDKEWEEFEQRIEVLMPHLAWNKKRTLLRKQLTDEDRDAFMSRNLNDMRYASRAVADYMRKYFKFSDARSDINDLSRVQVVAGGITALLRYSWGLHKDREIDDTHHAIDATVVACTTRGHVFCLSNLAKKYEQNIKHRFNDIFEKNHALRNILEEKLLTMNVSRMERHTVTGSAHKETIYELKGEDEKPKAGRIMHVNEGWAEMGVMVRADIFCESKPKQGKKAKLFMVPIYTHDLLQDTLPCKAIVTNAPAEQWMDISDKTKYYFCFSLFKDDLISIEKKGEKTQYFYVDFIQGTQTNIKIKPINSPSTKHKIINFGINSGILRKHRIDILGNITRVRKEKRLGTKKEQRAIKVIKEKAKNNKS